MARWGSKDRGASWDRVAVEQWPDPSAPARYAGARLLVTWHDGQPHPVGVVQRWDGTARVGVLWPVSGPLPGPLPVTSDRAYDDDPDLQLVIRVGVGWNPWGPDLVVEPRDAAKTDTARWEDLAGKLGVVLPWWPAGLRLPDLILAWRPGAPAVTAPAAPDLEVEPLLRAAVDYPDTHPTRRTLIAFARKCQRGGTASAEHELRDINGEFSPPPDSFTIAAWPLPAAVEDDAIDDLDETVRRAGWHELLARSDNLAAACVRQAMFQDGGADFPSSYAKRLTELSSQWSHEWVARLVPAAPTVAHQRLLSPLEEPREAIDALVDPATDAPVVRTSDGEYCLALPQRLPTFSPLEQLILDRPVIWVRVADGTLFPAPHAAGYGIEWGYAGGGPGALALLVDRLLVDITAPGAETPAGAPRTLDDFFQQDRPKGTVLTRDELERARDGH